MLQIRNKVFETNSSSTHSISIDKNAVSIPDTIELHYDEYGTITISDHLKNYLYTAILCHDISIQEDPEFYQNESLYLPKLKAFFDKYKVKYDMQEPYVWSFGYVDTGHLDDEGHYFNNELLEVMFNNENQDEAEHMMKQCFFGDSDVYIDVQR